MRMKLKESMGSLRTDRDKQYASFCNFYDKSCAWSFGRIACRSWKCPKNLIWKSRRPSSFRWRSKKVRRTILRSCCKPLASNTFCAAENQKKQKARVQKPRRNPRQSPLPRLQRMLKRKMTFLRRRPRALTKWRNPLKRFQEAWSCKGKSWKKTDKGKLIQGRQEDGGKGGRR